MEIGVCRHGVRNLFTASRDKAQLQFEVLRQVAHLTALAIIGARVVPSVVMLIRARIENPQIWAIRERWL